MDGCWGRWGKEKKASDNKVLNIVVTQESDTSIGGWGVIENIVVQIVVYLWASFK